MTLPLPITLYNTESRTKQRLEPLEAGHVRMYTCGPTVYNFAHIGNFRAYLFEDLLRRTLKFCGYKVTQVMNLTDVDDKTLRGAIAEKVSLKAFTQPYIDAFFEDLATLNIEKVEHYPAATDFIPAMIEMIEKLMQKQMAYRGGDGSIYFPIKSFARYGCLSHLNLEALRAGASERITADEYDKENISDFVLWKAYEPERDGDIFWESPFGRGRPGWHIECSTMAMSLLGETIDIHVGGIDNMFPHHENEIAQSEAVSGKCFSRLWMHCDHLIVDGKKMSKSAGNFYTLRDLLLRGYSGREVRLMLLHTHYKSPLNFTFQGLDGARSTLHRLQAIVRRLEQVAGSADMGEGFPHVKELFSQALADDLNISEALAVIFDFIRDLNALCDKGDMTQQAAAQALHRLHDCDKVLGLLEPVKAVPQTFSSEVMALVQQREEARQRRDWTLADALRNEVTTLGFHIDDTPHGPRLGPLESTP